jgi:hypothetical protein
MTSPLVVVLVVALGDGGDDGARLLGRTVQDSLASDAVVLMREEPSLDDARITGLGDELRADTLVVVTWGADTRRRQAPPPLRATDSTMDRSRDRLRPRRSAERARTGARLWDREHGSRWRPGSDERVGTGESS